MNQTESKPARAFTRAPVPTPEEAVAKLMQEREWRREYQKARRRVLREQADKVGTTQAPAAMA